MVVSILSYLRSASFLAFSACIRVSFISLGLYDETRYYLGNRMPWMKIKVNKKGGLYGKLSPFLFVYIEKERHLAQFSAVASVPDQYTFGVKS